jgi:hypothetical protein
MPYLRVKHENMTREEINAKQREYRAKNGNLCTKKYEKTRRGFLMRSYRNMESRVRGIQAAKAHLYAHIESIPDREQFYQWAKECPEFDRLFLEWEAKGYDRKLTPSVDRINSSEGYNLSNMRWITHSENSRLGAINRNRRKP